MKRGWMRPIGEKIRESLASVLPISGIVLLLSITLSPLSTGTMVMFLFGALMLILGMGLFTVGVDLSMMPMGEGIGVEISKTRSLSTPVILCFMLGAMITIAEPDLQLLARVQGRAQRNPARPAPHRVRTESAAANGGPGGSSSWRRCRGAQPLPEPSPSGAAPDTNRNKPVFTPRAVEDGLFFIIQVSVEQVKTGS